jgi:hypothetical protein
VTDGKSQTTPLPGPWEVVWLQGDKLGSPSEVCVAGTDNRVAFMASDGNLGTARLIAAAPELLSLVKRFVALPGGAWHQERHAANEARLMQEARDLLAHVEGRQ